MVALTWCASGDGGCGGGRSHCIQSAYVVAGKGCCAVVAAAVAAIAVSTRC